MKNSPPVFTKKTIIRELTLNVGTLTEILSLYVAYLLGADKWELGLFVLLVCVVINNALSRGWLYLIKN
jgi:hypothetical protein